MWKTVSNYQGLVIDVVETFTFERRDLEVEKNQTPADKLDKKAEIEGEMSAYDYFLGLVPKLALEYGLPPYLFSMATDLGAQKKYHAGEPEEEVVQRYAYYVAALLRECKLQKDMANGKYRKYEGLAAFPNRESAFWFGAWSGYIRFMTHITNAASVPWFVPIPGFLSQAQIETDDTPLYVI